MRFLSALALAVLASPALAQSNISLYPGNTSSASRGDIGISAGETLQGFHVSHWRGIGGNGARCAIDGFVNVVQDQNSATQETYHMIVRAGSDANGPTTGTASTALLHRIGPIALPMVTAGGIHAWVQTVTLIAPVAMPCESFFAIGAELTAAPTFPADGMSTHISLGTLADQHANAIDNAWQIIGAATTATQPTGKLTWRYAMTLSGPSLQMANNGKLSNGGMFPLVGGTFSGHIDGANPNGTSLLFMDIAIAPGFLIFPGTAHVYLPGVAARILSTVTLDTNGDGTHTLGVVPSINPPITVYFQAAISGGSGPQLSNAQATTFDQ